MPPFPKVIGVLLCEQIRQEQGGKLTLLGFSGMLPHINLIVPRLDGAIQVAFVVLLEYAEGTFDWTFELKRPDGVVMFSQPSKFSFPPKSTSAHLGLQMLTVFPLAGRYRIRITGDGSVRHETYFEIQQGTA